MDCQIGSRRCATWDEIEDAPQIKRLREDKVQEQIPQQPIQHQVVQQQQQKQLPAQQNTPAPAETPKFYISAPIQGFTVNNEGGCRYLFF
ncbi:Protein CBG09347 [Caenorhabditis briggsae]|uniref:Uncharacterized protein n=2 Tax=Caenorhabditis briggsae TaxID=6238 RepID=A0AAE9F0M4_CAEBR|nr:Protein CBG09347 [Caenorhabditis briggsae]ULT90012.1 hypothetical protein L3Y34_008418 [Caenorhabditis briggsae]UMM35812.1 hypothetical protein L5515_008266 [Caenorhabditis briggsae]CAP29224.2 Protein CBG09347 [Caenorhabditis briggsae]